MTYAYDDSKKISNPVWYVCPQCGDRKQDLPDRPTWCDECEMPMVRE